MANPTPHGGQVFSIARFLDRRPSEIWDFSANINPLGPPDSVKAAVRSAIDTLQHYPDSTHHESKEILAHQLTVDPGSLLIGNGAAEIIDMVLRYRRPRRVIVLDPAFGEYRAAAHRNRISVVGIPLGADSFEVPWDDIVSTAETGDLVVWNNPHNPSGRCFGRQTYEAPLRLLSDRGVFLLIDESFLDFVPAQEEVSALSFLQSPQSLVTVVRSLTKYYAIPGLRFGFAVADPHWVQQVETVRDGWSVNQLAQAAAIAGLMDTEFKQRSQTWLHQTQRQVAALWQNSAQYVRYPTQVNFFLLRWAREETSRQLSQALQSQAILVRRADDFVGLGPAYWRIAIRGADDNEHLYQATQALLHHLGMQS